MSEINKPRINWTEEDNSNQPPPAAFQVSTPEDIDIDNFLK